MLSLNKNLVGMEAEHMVYRAGQYLIWELIAVVAACVLIDLTVLFVYNFRGKRRQYRLIKKILKKEV